MLSSRCARAMPLRVRMASGSFGATRTPYAVPKRAFSIAEHWPKWPGKWIPHSPPAPGTPLLRCPTDHLLSLCQRSHFAIAEITADPPLDVPVYLPHTLLASLTDALHLATGSWAAAGIGLTVFFRLALLPVCCARRRRASAASLLTAGTAVRRRISMQ